MPGRFKLNIDNPGASGAGGVLRDSYGDVCLAFSKHLGECININAELQAILFGLRYC